MKNFFEKALTVIAALSMTVLPSSHAEAHNISSRHRHWTSPPLNVDVSTGHIVTPFCDGKYEEVASGLQGVHASYGVHFYRFTAGLPKLSGHGEYRTVGASTRQETRAAGVTPPRPARAPLNGSAFLSE